MVGERGAEHRQHVGFVHQPAGDRRAAPAEDTGTQRVVIGHQALRLEGRQDGRAELFRQRDHRPDPLAGTVAHDHGRPPSARQDADRALERLRVGGDSPARHPTRHRRRPGVRCREHLAVRLAGGEKVEALAYVVDKGHAQYAGRLPEAELLRLVRRGVGISGANPDYVRQTHAHLAEMGVTDPVLAYLAAAL